MNRVTLYGYFLDELQNYYKFVGLEGLDHSYFKIIRKQGRKEDVLKGANLNKAIEMLI